MSEALFYSHVSTRSDRVTVYGSIIAAMIFRVTGADFAISRVDLFLQRYYHSQWPDSTPGNFTCEIQSVNQTTLNPTGVTLAYKILNLNGLEAGEMEWVTFTLESSADLEANKYYAILFYDTGFTPDPIGRRDWMEWWGTDEDEYPTGELRYSPNGGSTWTDGSEVTDVDVDLIFKVYGDWTEEQSNWAMFYPPLPTGITLNESGTPPDNPPGSQLGTPTGVNNMITVRKLIAAANSRIWVEDI